MADLAIDFYGARPDPAAVKAAGYSAVLFYLRNATDPHAYINAGLGVGTIFEYQADESLQGAAKGAADGRLAAQQMTALGQPHGTLHTVNLADFAPTPGELSTIEAYWHAYQAETAAWHVLPYGTGWLLQAMGQSGWQNAMNDNGVTGSTVVAQAVLYQRTRPTRPQIAGTRPGDYDENAILANLPWWASATPSPAPTPVPVDVQPARPIPGQEFLMYVEFSATLGSDGTGYVPIPIPAGCTKVLGGFADVADPTVFNPVRHDGDIVRAPDSCRSPSGVVCQPAVAAKGLKPGTQHLRIVGGIPNHYYTGRAICG